MEENSQLSESVSKIVNPIKLITASQIPYSCLILQMTLHYNILFSPIHYYILTLEYFKQADYFKELDKFISTVCLILGIFVEIPRLLAGYLGNYHHKIKGLLLFLLVSSFFQVPVQILTLQSSLTESKQVKITTSIILAFMMVEIFTSVQAIKWIMDLWQREIFSPKNDCTKNE